ncbi:MAG: hypothetical protein RLZ37_1915, partial [Actinomycetota bacterium]
MPLPLPIGMGPDHLEIPVIVGWRVCAHCLAKSNEFGDEFLSRRRYGCRLDLHVWPARRDPQSECHDIVRHRTATMSDETAEEIDHHRAVSELIVIG